MCKRLVVILIAPKLNVGHVVEIVRILITVKEVLVVPTIKIVEVQLLVGKLHLKQSTSFAETVCPAVQLEGANCPSHHAQPSWSAN